MVKPTVTSLQESIDDFRQDFKSNIERLQNEIISIKETVIQNLLEENKRLRKKIEKLESKNDDVQEDLVEVERHSHNLDQYTRRNNIEISGIPNSVKDKDLEGKCIDIFSSVDIDVKPEEIEACHRLPSRNANKDKNVIVRFVNRKVIEKACSKESRNKLSACSKLELGFQEDTKLFFNENLSPYYRRLAWMCRELKRKKEISGTWFRDGKLFYKMDDDSYPECVSHSEDLYEAFPDFFD